MTSTSPKTSSPTYQRFLTESPEFSTCRYGHSTALGMRGPYQTIESMHVLLANYHRSLALHWLSADFAYVTISPSDLKAAIRLFLYANILHSGEVPTDTSWDDDTETYSLTQDIGLVIAIASECAEAFVAGLPVRSFIPSERATPAHEYQLALA